MATVVRRHVLPRLRIHGLTFVADAVVVCIAYALAELMRFDGAIPTLYLHHFYVATAIIVPAYALVMYGFGVHRRMWRYVGTVDVRAMLGVGLAAGFLIGMADLLLPGSRLLPASVVLGGPFFAIAGLLAVRLWRRFMPHKNMPDQRRPRVLIVGAGNAGRMVASDLLLTRAGRETPVGFVDDDPHKLRMRLSGLPVLGSIGDLPGIVEREKVDVVGIAIPSASAAEYDRILSIAEQTSARIQVLPSLSDLMAGKDRAQLRDIDLNELLNRTSHAPRALDRVDYTWLAGRTVLVTGAAGSIGSEICRQLVQLGVAQVLGLDNNETGLFHLHGELQPFHEVCPFIPTLADITDEVRLAQVFRTYRPHIVFHAAAYKHVPILEGHPYEAVQVNVTGTLNLCRLAKHSLCERFVFISTDKAVNPVNVLGFSKRTGELLVRAHSGRDTVFCSVRFGNVIGSRGSALPEFIRQIDSGGPVTVTHPEVERYFMTIPEAVTLVIQAAVLAEGGELFMLDMGEPVKIVDLVHRLIRWRGLRVGTDIEVVFTGLRQGEKLTEDLAFDAEDTAPTAHPAIRVVRDHTEARLPALEHSIALLTHLARQGDHTAVVAALQQLAGGGSVHEGVLVDRGA